MRQETYTIPTWMVMALEYEDRSELTEQDARQLDNFIADISLRGSFYFTFSEHEFFSWYNDTYPGRQGATCCEMTVTWLDEPAEDYPETYDRGSEAIPYDDSDPNIYNALA